MGKYRLPISGLAGKDVLTMLLGVDVSNWQAVIDWGTLGQAGFGFAMIKASEGVDYLDPQFGANWAGIGGTSMVRGAYGFMRPSLGSGRENAEQLFRSVGRARLGDIFALDLEDPDVAPDADLMAFTIDAAVSIRREVGVWPLIYSGVSYLQAHNITPTGDLANCGLWLANWSGGLPLVLAGWPFWAMCQFGTASRVPGVNWVVDLDVFNGRRDQLLAYGWQG